MWETFKRFVLSASVVVLFVLYAFQKQADTDSAGRAVARVIPTTTIALDDTVPGTSETVAADKPEPTATARVAKALPTKTPTSVAETTAVEEPTSTPTAVTTRKPTATPKPTKEPEPTATPEPEGQYADGTYEGSVEDAHWGDLQVVAIVENGELVDVEFASYPNHRSRSVRINERAMPLLITEALIAQSADVDIVSGATDTSEAFVRSLETALQAAAR